MSINELFGTGNGNSSASKPVVLVLDDEEVQLELAEGKLGGLGFKVHTAINRQEALGYLQRFHYDAVLCDTFAPDFYGPDLADEMKELHSGAIIGTSNRPGLQIPHDWEQRNAGFLPKPVSTDSWKDYAGQIMGIIGNGTDYSD